MLPLNWKFFVLIFFGIIITIIHYTSKSNLPIKKLILNNTEFIYPRVSVIIPVYNTENYISDCLDSLLNQTLREIEIICVDDGSTDNSLSILKKYAEMDNRIIILKQKNKGGGIARNYGMSIAKGEYLSFLDSDDFFDKNLLYDSVNAADKTIADIVIFLYKTYNISSNMYNNLSYGFRKYFFKHLLFNYHSNPKNFFQSFNPTSWNKLFRHSFIKKNGLYFQGNKRANDLFFTMTSFVSAKKIYFLNETLVYYRVGLLTNCQSTNALFPFDFYKALLSIKKFLKEKKIFSKLERSYKNLARDMTIYNINQNDEKNILVYEELKREGFQNMGIDIIPSKKISKKFHKKYIKYLDKIYFRKLNTINNNIINNNFKVNIIRKSHFLFKPKVSVIFPTYNAEKHLIVTLDSILKQTLKDIEIICIDDGSIDNSLNLIQKYALKDNRIQIISIKNMGLSESKNLGVKYSNGEYIFFIYAGDFLELNGLSDLYNKAIENNLDIVLFDSNPLSNEINTEKVNFDMNLETQENNYSMILSGSEIFSEMKDKKEYVLYISSEFIKKELFINANLSFYPGILHADLLFNLISILNANKTIYINQTYYKYRDHNKSTTISYNINSLFGYLIVYCEIKKLYKNCDSKKELKMAIFNEMLEIEQKIYKINKIISEDENYLLLNKVTNYQKIQYKNIINRNENEILVKDLKKKIKTLRKKNKIFKYIIIFLSLILLYSLFFKVL